MSSHEMMGEFAEVHLANHRGTPLEIIDFGAQMIGPEQLSYTTHLDDPAWNYRGVDIVEGRNVDVVLADPYRWNELPSESVDLFVSGQAFEHIEHFWVTMFEVARVLKPGGVAAIIAPSSGYEHRFPVDCWRFYPDGFAALGRYAQCDVIDSFADWGNGDWGDAILVIRKPDWSPDERTRFDHRSGMQRLMLSDLPITAARIADEWQYQPQSGTANPSPLADVTAGALTKRLEARRASRIAAETDAALSTDAVHAKEIQRLHDELGSAHREVVALHARLEQTGTALVDAEKIAHASMHSGSTAAGGSSSSPTALYGKARSRVADLVGARGRQLYKRLRSRH